MEDGGNLAMTSGPNLWLLKSVIGNIDFKRSKSKSANPMFEGSRFWL